MNVSSNGQYIVLEQGREETRCVDLNEKACSLQRQ